MEVDIVIAISMLAGFVTFAYQVARVLRTYSYNRTVREALTRNSPLTLELLDKMAEKKTPRFGDGRAGLVLIALAAALVCYSLIQGDPVFPLFVGAVLLGRLWYLRRQGEIS
jgi:hypothetical protein